MRQKTAHKGFLFPLLFRIFWTPRNVVFVLLLQGIWTYLMYRTPNQSSSLAIAFFNNILSSPLGGRRVTPTKKEKRNERVERPLRPVHLGLDQ
jgi:hypothetical protein